VRSAQQTITATPNVMAIAKAWALDILLLTLQAVKYSDQTHKHSRTIRSIFNLSHSRVKQVFFVLLSVVGREERERLETRTFFCLEGIVAALTK
jgi:hypothetical protein